MPRLRTHDVTLKGETAHGVSLALRPMTERDWAILHRWNTDPEVLYYCEGDDITEWDFDEMKEMYRGVSERAHCFIIEVEGDPVGECWLQRMNLPEILREFPGRDCRRIDIMIGEKRLWGEGIGTAAIRLLAEFGLRKQKADAIFACGIADYNARSLAAFRRAGFRRHRKVLKPPGGKSRYEHYLVMRGTGRGSHPAGSSRRA